MSPSPLEAEDQEPEDREGRGRGRTGAASLLTDGKPAASGPLYPECWAAVCLVSDVTRLQHRTEQAPVASGFKSPLTGRQTPPPPPPCQAPVPQAPSGVHVALGVTSPLSRAPAPCSVLQAPPSRGDSTACGSAGARSPRGAQGRPAPRRPASVPCVPAGPAPSGHGGRAHLCEHEAGSPTEGPAASCTQEPRPPSVSSLVPRALPVSPPQICD